jgi:hypothetical protein
MPLDELPSFVAAFGLWIAEPAVYPRGSSSGKPATSRSSR